MGWSCSEAASERLDALTRFCVSQTGSQNVYLDRGVRHFFEPSRREHSDGAVTGSFYLLAPPGEHCVKKGTFRIEGNGRFSRGPKVLKAVPAFTLLVDFKPITWVGVDPHPTNDDVRAYIKGPYIKQYYIGGINAHVSKMLGYIPYPKQADLIDFDTQKVVAVWRPATFEAWE